MENDDWAATISFRIPHSAFRISMNLDITVIYADDRVTTPRARQATAYRAIAPSRLAACATLVASAIWLFVVWFPLDTYLDRCLMRRTAFALPAGFDLGAMLFGRTPVPANLANPAPPNRGAGGESTGAQPQDETISAYRSPAAPAPSERSSPELSPGRQGLPIAVYSWVILMTAAGLALAMVAGAGLTEWLVNSESVRRVRLAALGMLLVVGIIAYVHWPRGGNVASISGVVEFALGLGLVLLSWAACVTLTTAQAARVGAISLGILGVVAWVIWGRYGTGVPEIAQRTGVMLAMATATVLGVALTRHALRLSAVAAVSVVVTIVATLAAIGYVHAIGGFVEFTPTPGTYVTAAGLQALAILPLWWVRRAAG